MLRATDRGASIDGSTPPTPLRRDRRGEATYWDIADIQFHCRISRSTAWRLVRESGFPDPVVIGKRALVWPRVEVLGFMETKRDSGHYTSHTGAAVDDARPAFTSRTVRVRAG